ncbi:MAG TPA: PAS domain S-box protein [Verrucomicrobiota bacterium]|nr:PAS domain S-box protein [Verrucomicrobiota bacterium]HPY30470.1 PAS domain S-box protein [Verrucomicrobiota bacterium]HQB15371.1 PAS domain S-box protein [Verrucomicrobiota bacterium]
MANKLKILHLEDEPDYAELVRTMLANEGLEANVVWVHDRTGFVSALATQEFDLILSDFNLPAFNGLEALKLVQAKNPDTPFILISGTIGEEAAIASLKAGATDYVLKQWSDRLIPAVRRAAREAVERRARLRTEREMQQQESYYRALTENIQDALMILNRDGTIRFCSPSLVRVLGYRPGALRERAIFDLVHPEDVPSARRVFEYGLANPGKAVTVELRHRHKDGHWRHLECVGQNLLEDVDIEGVLITSRDVTERKEAELQSRVLARLGRRLSAAIAQREAAIVIAEVAEELFGWDAFGLDLWEETSGLLTPVLAYDERGGQRHEISTPNSSTRARALARRVAERGAELIFREHPISPSQNTLFIGDRARPSASQMAVPIRNLQKMIGVLTIQRYSSMAYNRSQLALLQALADHCGTTVERIRAGEALRETERRFSGLFENSPDAIFVENLRGRVLDVNSAGCRLQGLTREELIGAEMTDLVAPEERASMRTGFQRLVSGEGQQLESVSLAADGRRTPVEIRASRIEYAGQPALLLHVRDVSERKRAESALRSSEMLFFSVWENSVDGMRLTDGEGNIVAVNEAFCKLMGLRRDQLEGQPYTVAYAESQDHERLLRKYRERFRDRVIERQIQRRLTLWNGAVVELEDTNSFVELPGRPPLLLGLFRDLTVQKRLEEQLRQSQKMEAIGQLAGGVAHDFNNILTVIQGHIALLQQPARVLPASADRSVQQIGQAAERAAHLTRQLLSFSRRQVLQPRHLDLNELVANLTKMLGRLLGENITLQLQYRPQPSWVFADAALIEQVVVNLAVNARDAMPQGGQLTLRVSVTDVDAVHVAEYPEAREGCFVCLTVSDTGVGVPPEGLRRIFEPFYTTKEVGKGTGLGLATAYGNIQQHEGWIEVESEPNRGTTFRVYLPHQSEVATPMEEETPEPAIRGGTEGILIVEDENAVRDLLSAILGCYGYQVFPAASGPEALEVWAKHQEAIALVLTDLVMPDRMSGRELAERLWQDRPGLKVVFTSGYGAEVVGRELVLQAGLNFIQKPYHPNKLVQTLREVLDQPAPDGKRSEPKPS